MPRYSEDVIADAMRKLVASASSGDGIPYWSAVERETGIPATTLRRWFQARGESNVEHLRVAEQAASDSGEQQARNEQTTMALLMKEPLEFLASLMLDLLRDTDRMLAVGSVTGLPRARQQQLELYDRFRAELETARLRRGLSEADVLAELVRQAEQMAPAHAVQLVEVFRRRRLV